MAPTVSKDAGATPFNKSFDSIALCRSKSDLFKARISVPIPAIAHRATPTGLRRLFLGLICGAMLSASSSSAQTTENGFAFDVRISLSAKAAAKLAALSEGIIVSASYSGTPTPSAAKHADEIGQIDLGREEIEMQGHAGTVHVTGAKVNQKHLPWIEGPVLLNINVYSARHSGQDNILACDFFDGELRNAARQPVSLHCSLIAEHIDTRHKQ